jgi:hypothetical protein
MNGLVLRCWNSKPPDRAVRRRRKLLPTVERVVYESTAHLLRKREFSKKMLHGNLVHSLERRGCSARSLACLE